MARTLENPAYNPTYLDYFGMTQPPFAPLPGQSPMFLSEQYALLMAHLSSATEQTDCMMVICGADGSGKTLLLNRYISSLGEDVSYATFDETCADGVEFYCVLLRQLGFPDITGSLKELRHIAREFLIHRGKANDPVLLIVDNAHLVKPSVFEQLRWIAETKVDDCRVLSIVLAGNADLPRILESPAMRSIQFRSRINFNIRVYTEEETGDYVRHRLRLAGGINAAKFSNEARPLIYQFTGGVPSSINMLCNEVLSEAYNRETRVISANLVRSVADSHDFALPEEPPKNKRRRKTDANIKLVIPEQRKAERIASREVAAKIAGDKSDVYIQDLLNQIARLSEQTGELKAESKQALGAVSERDAEISELREQFAQLESEWEQAQAEIGSRQDEISELQGQLAQFESAWEQSRADIGARDEEISNLKERLADVESDRTQARSNIGARDEEIDELRGQIEKLESESGRTQSDIGAREQEISELRETLADVESDRKQAMLDLSARDTEIGELTKQLGDLKSEWERSRADIGTRDGEVSALQQQLAEFESDKQQALADIGARDAEIGELKERISELESQQKQTHSDLGTRDKEVIELQKQVAIRTKESARLASTVEDNADKIKQLKSDLSASTKALKKSNKASDKFAKDLRNEQHAASRANEALTRAEEKAATLDSLKSQLQASVRELTRDLRQANKEIDRNVVLAQKVESLQKDADEKARDLAERDKMLGEVERSLDEAQSECEVLRGSAAAVGELKKSVLEKEARIAELEAQLGAHVQEQTMIQSQPPADRFSFSTSKSKEETNRTAKRDSTAEKRALPVAILEVCKDGQLESAIEIDEATSRIMIGRYADCDLCLDSEFVSRHHALIFFTRERVYIEDLNSFNGTFVNSNKVLRCDLNPDDAVVIGDFHVRLRRP